MIVKLLTEHFMEFLSLKRGCRGSSESTYVKNATLLEISCRASYSFSDIISFPSSCNSHSLAAYIIGPDKEIL